MKTATKFLLVSLSVLLSSCVEYETVTIHRTIKDIVYETYETSTTLQTSYGQRTYNYLNTVACFLLDDSLTVPISSNFNPCSPETYIGKPLTITLRVETDKKYLYEDSKNDTSTDVVYNEEDYSEYICDNKYISKGKYYIRVYTNKKPAIKTIQVTPEAYNRTREGKNVLKQDIEPYLNKSK